ncbi:hypothetical protein [Marinitoga lauensis]|uniref:hypothetical protein n=1 Tax=Marinitoga lauensis TaxID=2201189 RepID=UPI001404BB51|nr:hypothetical protein [Marinitoga lauensis]
MFKALGFNVIKLKRIKFGPWTIDEVRNPGDIKKIDSKEVQKFKSYLKSGS